MVGRQITHGDSMLEEHGKELEPISCELPLQVPRKAGGASSCRSPALIAISQTVATLTATVLSAPLISARDRLDSPRVIIDPPQQGQGYRGGASLPALEQIEKILRQILVEGLVNDDLPLTGARLAWLAALPLGHEPRDRLTGLGDDDLLTHAHCAISLENCYEQGEQDRLLGRHALPRDGLLSRRNLGCGAETCQRVTA
jgi:hypothetical protein